MKRTDGIDKEYDLFGNDITDLIKREEEREIQKKKERERAIKASETRKAKQGKLERELDRNFCIAFCNKEGNLFGEKPTDKERKDALDFVRKNIKKHK